MKKQWKLLTIATILIPTLLSITACGQQPATTNFHYQNLVTTNNLMTIATDNNDNLYFATFDNISLAITGEKIWKYNLTTKQQQIYWENKNFKTGSFNMAVDNNGNIYLGSSGGVKILNHKNMFSNMPLVTNATTSITYFKDHIYVTTFDGFYKYNTNNKTTEKIILPNNETVNQLFIDKHENIYLKIYKATTYGGLVIKKGQTTAEPIVGDNFFNTYSWQLITEINNNIYFASVDFQTDRIKLYVFLNNHLTYLRDLPPTTDNIFNVNQQLGLIINEKEDTTIVNTINLQSNLKMETKYKIKNKGYFTNILQNYQDLYLANNKKIAVLNW